MTNTPAGDSTAYQLRKISQGKGIEAALLDAWLSGYAIGVADDLLWKRAYEPPKYPRLPPQHPDYLTQAEQIYQAAQA